MSVGARSRELVRRRVQSAGEGQDLVLRRRHTLRTPGGVPGSLLTEAEALSGLTSLVLTSGTLTGKVPAGLVFAVAGHGQSYSVSGEAAVDEGRLAVSITPPLSDDVPAETMVTITQPYGEYQFPVMRSRERDETLASRRLERGEVRYAVAASGLVAPKLNDLVVDPPAKVTAIEPIGQSDPPAGWYLTVGGAP